MYIDPAWRILTIGDGDLSFSHALCERYHPVDFEASIYDSEATLLAKYQLNELDHLRTSGITVHTGVDITTPKTLDTLSKKFDLVIFQFPLITRCSTNEEFLLRGNATSSNTLNRSLLRQFLIHSFDHLLDSHGKQLCYITSKDVKPFYDWDLENSTGISTSPISVP